MRASAASTRATCSVSRPAWSISAARAAALRARCATAEVSKLASGFAGPGSRVATSGAARRHGGIGSGAVCGAASAPCSGAGCGAVGLAGAGAGLGSGAVANRGRELLEHVRPAHFVELCLQSVTFIAQRPGFAACRHTAEHEAYDQARRNPERRPKRHARECSSARRSVGANQRPLELARQRVLVWTGVEVRSVRARRRAL